VADWSERLNDFVALHSHKSDAFSSFFDPCSTLKLTSERDITYIRSVATLVLFSDEIVTPHPRTTTLRFDRKLITRSVADSMNAGAQADWADCSAVAGAHPQNSR